jgi:hypothetical protein
VRVSFEKTFELNKNATKYENPPKFSNNPMYSLKKKTQGVLKNKVL